MGDTKTTKGPERDELVANKRARGSLMHEMQNDAARIKEKARELREAIERLNARFLAADERRRAIVSAGADDPGPPPTPFALVGLLQFPLLLEHPPRQRRDLRRSPEEKAREAERRERELEEWRRNAPPDMAGLADFPGAIGGL